MRGPGNMLIILHPPPPQKKNGKGVVNSRSQTKLKLFLKFLTISIVYLMNKINITNYEHLKKNPNNVINDLYKLCFQNYRASLIIISSYKKNDLNCIDHFLV